MREHGPALSRLASLQWSTITDSEDQPALKAVTQLPRGCHQTSPQHALQCFENVLNYQSYKTMDTKATINANPN